MKISLTNAILKVLESGIATTIDIAWAMSTTKPESYRRFRSLRYSPASSIGSRLISDVKVACKDYRKYHALLSRLKKNGLVARQNNGDHNWVITQAGVSRLQKARTNPQNRTFVDRKGLTIVSYDIPERQRRERDRLRDILKIAEFKQIHLSLWYSEKKVTKEFLEILKELKILDGVHIFEISKSGSLNIIPRV